MCKNAQMDWNDLRYFLALARAGTLSGAARLCSVEHTTVSRRLGALEAALGVRLFERDARGYRLTGDGERLLETAQRIEGEVFGLQRDAASAAPELTGTVRISAPPVFASHFLAPRLANFHSLHPGIVLELAGEDRAVSLSRREADLALRMVRPEPASIVARQVGTMTYGLYGARTYLRQTPPEAWSFIAYDESLDHTPQQRWLHEIRDGRPLVFRSNDLASLHAVAVSGLGIAALPRFIGDADATLERISIDATPAARELWLAIHPDLRRSPRVRAVFDYLGELLRRHRHVLDPS